MSFNIKEAVYVVTPKDVYGDSYNKVVSQLKTYGYNIVSFSPPQNGQMYVAPSGIVYLYIEAVQGKASSPYFIVEKVEEWQSLTFTKTTTYTVEGVYGKSPVIPDRYKVTNFRMPNAGDIILSSWRYVGFNEAITVLINDVFTSPRLILEKK